MSKLTTYWFVSYYHCIGGKAWPSSLPVPWSFSRHAGWRGDSHRVTEQHQGVQGHLLQRELRLPQQPEHNLLRLCQQLHLAHQDSGICSRSPAVRWQMRFGPGLWSWGSLSRRTDWLLCSDFLLTWFICCWQIANLQFTQRLHLNAGFFSNVKMLFGLDCTCGVHAEAKYWHGRSGGLFWIPLHTKRSEVILACRADVFHGE